LYQIASRPDEVNYNVYETLTLIMDTETTRKLFNPFKENIRGSFKNKYKLF